MKRSPFRLSAAQPARLVPLPPSEWSSDGLWPGARVVGAFEVACSFRGCRKLGYASLSRDDTGYEFCVYREPRDFTLSRDPETGCRFYWVHERTRSYHRRGLAGRSKRPNSSGKHDWDSSSPLGTFGLGGVEHGMDPGVPIYVVCSARSCLRTVHLTVEDVRAAIASAVAVP